VKSVFVDTSALIALFSRQDQNHGAARMTMQGLAKGGMMLLMSDYILDETVTGILADVGHDAAVKAGEFILGSNIVRTIWLDESLKRKAWEYFQTA